MHFLWLRIYMALQGKHLCCLLLNAHVHTQNLLGDRSLCCLTWIQSPGLPPILPVAFCTEQRSLLSLIMAVPLPLSHTRDVHPQLLSSCYYVKNVEKSIPSLFHLIFHHSNFINHTHSFITTNLVCKHPEGGCIFQRTLPEQYSTFIH